MMKKVVKQQLARIEELVGLLISCQVRQAEDKRNREQLNKESIDADRL